MAGSSPPPGGRARARRAAAGSGTPSPWYHDAAVMSLQALAEPERPRCGWTSASGPTRTWGRGSERERASFLATPLLS